MMEVEIMYTEINMLHAKNKKQAAEELSASVVNIF